MVALLNAIGNITRVHMTVASRLTVPGMIASCLQSRSQSRSLPNRGKVIEGKNTSFGRP